jgi:hypothetical protein
MSVAGLWSFIMSWYPAYPFQVRASMPRERRSEYLSLENAFWMFEKLSCESKKKRERPGANEKNVEDE